MSCHQSGNGIVIPGTPIAIDFWNVILKPQAKVFFLTHCHSDHLEGLTSTWRQPIYTTSFNAHWLAEKRKIALATFIIVEAGTSVEVPLDLIGQNKALVTAIDANHVPGAVMFLLQGYFGTILYTGDFRYYPEMPLQPGLNNLQAGDVDVLYLDNTYCHPIYNFPSRDDASLIILNIIKCHPKHRIKLGCRNLGREELYLFLGVQMDELVLVPPAVLLSLQLLRAPDYFTTDPAQSRIHLVPLAQVSQKSHQCWNTEYPTISIRASAMTTIYLPAEEKDPKQEMGDVQCCPVHPCCSEMVATETVLFNDVNDSSPSVNIVGVARSVNAVPNNVDVFSHSSVDIFKEQIQLSPIKNVVSSQLHADSFGDGVQGPMCSTQVERSNEDETELQSDRVLSVPEDIEGTVMKLHSLEENPTKAILSDSLFSAGILNASKSLDLDKIVSHQSDEDTCIKNKSRLNQEPSPQSKFKSKDAGFRCICSQIREYSCANVPGLFNVPYSDHSNFEELRATVTAIKPRAVAPIVAASARIARDPEGKSNMSLFDDLLYKDTGNTHSDTQWKDFYEAQPTNSVQFDGVLRDAPQNRSVAVQQRTARLCEKLPYFSIPDDVSDLMSSNSNALSCHHDLPIKWKRKVMRRRRERRQALGVKRGVHFEELS